MLFVVAPVFFGPVSGAEEPAQAMSQEKARELANDLLARSRAREYSTFTKTTLDVKTNRPLSRHFRKLNSDGTLWERIEYLKSNGDVLSVVITNDAGSFKIVGDTVIKNEYNPNTYSSPPSGRVQKFYATKIDADTVNVNGDFIIRRSECGDELFATVLSWTEDGYEPPKPPPDPGIVYRVTETAYNGIPCYLVRIEEELTSKRLTAAREALRQAGRPTSDLNREAMETVTEHYLRRDDCFPVALVTANDRGRTIAQLYFADIDSDAELPDRLFELPAGKRFSTVRTYHEKLNSEDAAYTKLLPVVAPPAKADDSPGFFSGVGNAGARTLTKIGNGFWDYGHYVLFGFGVLCLGVAVYGKIKLRQKEAAEKYRSAYATRRRIK